MDKCTLVKFSFFTSLLVTAKTGMPESGPNLELTRTQNTDNTVYPEQNVTFTCTTRGSGIQVWRSDDYMVAGDTIEFLSTTPQGRVITKTSVHNSEIIAILICIDQENLVLKSTLSVIVSPRPSTFNVLCSNVGLGLRDNITLHVLDMPAQELTSSLPGANACPGDRINFTCITYSSPILAWQSDDYLGKGAQVEFTSQDQEGKMIPSAFNSNTSAVLNSILIESGRTNIISTLYIVVPVDSRDDSRVQNVTCINGGIGTRKTINFSVAVNCSSNDSMSTQIVVPTVAISHNPDGSSLRVSVIVAIVTVIFAVLLLIPTIILHVFIRKRTKKETKNIQTTSLRRSTSVQFVNEVYLRIRDQMAPEWRQFGEKLGIDSSELDAIESRGGSEYDNLRRVITYLDRSSTEELKWANIVPAINAVTRRKHDEAAMNDVREHPNPPTGQGQEDLATNPAIQEPPGIVNQACQEQKQPSDDHQVQEEEQVTASPCDQQLTADSANQGQEQLTTLQTDKETPFELHPPNGSISVHLKESQTESNQESQC